MANIDFDLTDGVRKFFLLGVGAVATGAEKSQEIVNDLVKKGELTVAQGKALNEELTVKAKAAVGDTEGTLLKTRLESMTPEERAAYVKHVNDLAAEVDGAATKDGCSCKVEVEDGTSEACACDASEKADK